MEPFNEIPTLHGCAISLKEAQIAAFAEGLSLGNLIDIFQRASERRDALRDTARAEFCRTQQAKFEVPERSPRRDVPVSIDSLLAETGSEETDVQDVGEPEELMPPKSEPELVAGQDDDIEDDQDEPDESQEDTAEDAEEVGHGECTA